MGPRRAVVRQSRRHLLAISSTMSVATRNPFAILDGQSFFLLLPLIPHPPPPEDDARPPSPPPSAAPDLPPQQPSASAKRARGGPAARGGRYYQRGGSRQNTDRDPPSSEDPPVAPDAKQRRCPSLSPFVPSPSHPPPQPMASAERGVAEAAATTEAEAAPLTSTAPPE